VPGERVFVYRHFQAGRTESKEKGDLLSILPVRWKMKKRKRKEEVDFNSRGEEGEKGGGKKSPTKTYKTSK